jgi:hypothetical protein
MTTKVISSFSLFPENILEQLISHLQDKGHPFGTSNHITAAITSHENSLPLVKLMTDKGSAAGVTSRDRNNFTPLMLAALMGNLEVYVHLATRGADEFLECLYFNDKVRCYIRICGALLRRFLVINFVANLYIHSLGKINFGKRNS